MYFLVGLGIILAIVYGNMLLDYIKDKKRQKQQDGTAPEEKPEMAETAEEKEMLREQNVLATSLMLSAIIEQKLRQKQDIFGLPLTLRESDGQGKLVTLDQEDNIYIIETVVRPEYDDFKEQVLEDMAAEQRRTCSGAAAGKIYAVICTDQPTASLKALAESEKGFRLFRFDVVFDHIM